MAEARCLGEAGVPGTLVKIAWYPGLVLQGEGLVKGEVYEVGSALLAELDEFEGLDVQGGNGEYRRIRARVTVQGKECEVWIYEWLKGIDGYEVVESGDWLSQAASR